MSDVHVETYCHRCYGANVVWSAPSPLWNAVMRDTDDGTDAYDGIVCPVCFIQLAETMAVAGPGWYLTADDVQVSLATHTRDGRVWSDASRLWVKVDESSCPKCGGNWTTTGGDTAAIRCADVWHTRHFPLGTAKVRITPIGDPQ